MNLISHMRKGKKLLKIFWKRSLDSFCTGRVYYNFQLFSSTVIYSYIYHQYKSVSLQIMRTVMIVKNDNKEASIARK